MQKGNCSNRCKKHPKYNPKNELNGDSVNCMVCNGLHSGSRPIGDFSGEYEADKSDINRAKTKIGPLSLEQFGHIRFDFGFDYHQDDGPSWHADRKTKMIYLDEELSPQTQKKLSKKYKCKVNSISWMEPKVASLSALSDPKGKASTLLMTFGESKKSISFTVKEGMTVEELQESVSQLSFELIDVPKDIIKKTEVSKKR